MAGIAARQRVLPLHEDEDRLDARPVDLDPLHRLYVALIRSAVEDATTAHHVHLVHGKACHSRCCPRCAAQAWLGGARAPVPFALACDALGVDAADIRRRLT